MHGPCGTSGPQVRPLVVGMDTHGQSIYKNLKEAALHKIDEAYPA